MDVHDQHLAEINSARQQETAASEAKYRALANSSPQIVFVVSDRRGLSFCNSQWITYSGQSEAQAHGNGFLEYVHPDDVPKCKLPELTEDGSVPTNVPTSLPPDQYRGSSSSSEDSSSSDTERAVMSPGSPSLNKLEMPQAKLSKLASTGILRVTKDASGRASYSTEVRLRSKDGEYRWHLVRILLEKALAEDTDEETWYGTATDINDHKLLEQTLKETMDAKTRFLSNMSHEIRTPLNGISGMVNFLLDSPLIPEQLEHVNIIKASTDSLLNLINDILDLSKVEAGMIKLDMGWLHIPSLLEEVNDLNMGLAIQKGLELNYLVDEGVPSMVKGDKFRIRQVLLNVVGNAIKFTQKGEVFVRCRPCPPERQGSLGDGEAMVQFEVIDTGKGFNEEEAKYLFKRFSQIDASSTRQHGGTGLGLAISMQFVELHGGKMDARSVPGKGSTFFFTIKFSLPTDENHPPTPTPTVGTPVFEPVNLPSPSPSALPPQKPMQAQVLQAQAAANILAERMTASPEYTDSIKSPVPSLTTSERSRDSPSISVSSGGSEPSLTGNLMTGKSSIRSERSSVSSFLQEVVSSKEDPIRLALPSRPSESERATSDDSSNSLASDRTILPSNIPSRRMSPLSSTVPPPMYSILVVCPLLHSQEATIRHIKNTLPQGIPHQVTGQSSLLEAQRMIGGDDPVHFTHIVLVLHDTVEVIAIMDQIFSSAGHEKTSVVVVSDPARKRELMKGAPQYDYDQLYLNNRLQFVYRPLKPSKFAAIFDPQKERELSTDRNQDNAQQVVVSQKLVFEELRRRIGGKGHKVLLVEDNKINQTVRTPPRRNDVQLTDALVGNPKVPSQNRRPDGNST
jgi:signal transduction histidine kinase